MEPELEILIKDDLLNDYDKLKNDYDNLQNEYIEIQNKYKELIIEKNNILDELWKYKLKLKSLKDSTAILNNMIQKT
jgi:predicted nuclease with TOPRIM domain